MGKAQIRILIAEDVELNRFILDRMFRKRGIRAVFAKNGQEAYDILKTEKFDFVFMDIQMPILSGIEVIEALKKNHIEVPTTVALTSNTFESLRAEALKSGMEEVLHKPLKNCVLDKILVKYDLIPGTRPSIAL